jgi:hypothetical protein
MSFKGAPLYIFTQDIAKASLNSEVAGKSTELVSPKTHHLQRRALFHRPNTHTKADCLLAQG